MRTVHLPIADPCHEDWDAMDRVERGRFCQSCVKQVYDLSSMTEPEASSLLRARAGSRICVRYCHDDAGQIRFRSPAPAHGSTCAPPSRLAWAGAVVMAAAMAACTPHQREEAPKRTVFERPSLMDTQVVGQVPFEPVDPAQVEPEVMPSKGEIVAIEPPPKPPKPPKPMVEKLGDIAVEPIIETKGNMIAAPHSASDEPCDSRPTQ